MQRVNNRQPAATPVRNCRHHFPLCIGRKLCLFFASVMVMLCCTAKVLPAQTPLHILEQPGGDVRAISFHGDNPLVVVLGTAEGAIFYSHDRGTTWQWAQSAQQPVSGYSVQQIVYDPRFKCFWAGLRHEKGYGLLLRGNEKGERWQKIEGSQPFSAIRSLLPLHTRGLLVGTDTGLWQLTITNLDGTVKATEQRKVFAPKPDSSVTALMKRREGSAEEIYVGTRRRGFVSSDGGAHFSPIWKGMAVDSHIFAFQNGGASEASIYAATCGWVYQRRGMEGSWRKLKQGLSDRRVYSLLWVQTAKQGAILLAGTPSGLFSSKNGGKEWKITALKNVFVGALAQSPHDGRIFIGVRGAGIVTADSELKSLRVSNMGLNARRFRVMVVKNGTWFAIDDGTSSDENAWWERPTEGNYHTLKVPQAVGAVNHVSLCTAHPGDDVKLLLGTNKGVFSLNRARREISELGDLKLAVRRILSLSLNTDVRRQKIFAATSRGLFVFNEKEHRWEDRSPKDYHGDCLDIISITPTEGAINLFLATLVGVYRSSDYGETWTYRSHNLPKQKTHLLMGDRSRPTTLYALTQKGLYISTSQGDHWNRITSYGLPQGISFMKNIFLHQKSLFFCNDANNGGLYFSTNRGMRWKAVPQLRGIRITDMALSPDQAGLWVCTLGHGMVVLPIP